MKKLGLFILLFSTKVFSQDGSFSFTLPVASKTSAGVFTTDSVLIRTLWSNKSSPAGKNTAAWDGQDDYGMPVSTPVKSYLVKVVSNNVRYAWQGTLGNTSDSMTGNTKLRGIYNCMAGLAFASNGYGYYCTGFSEGVASYYKFKTSAPQAKVDFYLNHIGRIITLNTEYVTTDDTNVYWGGLDSYSNTYSMVHAIRTSDDSHVMFAAGTPYAVTHGVILPSVISKVNQAKAYITGLSVQKKGNYLFVARSTLNQVQVLNKTSGTLIQTLTYTTPRAVCVDGSDNLWMITGISTVARYTVNGDGTLAEPNLTLAGLSEPLAIQVSGDGKIVVADGGADQQVKAFSSTTGAASWILGTPGGYFTDATVTNNKFYFTDVRGYSQKFRPVFLAFQRDGSFWVGDGGNSRVQHYSSDRNFINRIMSLGASYSVYADPNNPTRIWAGPLEFAVDYNVPLTGSSGWTLVKNWGANINSNYFDINSTSSFMYPTTLSNGKTYAIIRRTTAKNNREIVEFPSSGQVRFTGVYRTSSQVLAADGAIQVMNKGLVGGTSTITRYPLTGFDASDNPDWSAFAETIATTPSLTINDPNALLKGNCITSSNKVIIWNPDKFLARTTIYPGYHLGAIAKGGNTWLWKTEQATHANYRGPYPGPGYFDIGNGVKQYAGGTLSIVGRNLVTSYHGEFWKSGQTNKYNHYWDNGLTIGQFGKTKEEISGGAPAEYCGNALSPMAVADPNSANSMYLYHGDEATHSGVHRWKITGLNTITEQVIPINFPSAYRQAPPPANTLNLMEGLPFDSPLPNSINGWTRNPVTNNAGWDITTNYYVYDKMADRDIRLNFTQPTPQTYTLTRDLGTNSVKNFWKITGDIAWEGRDGGRSSVQVFLEILDANDKVLASINYNQNLKALKNDLIANGKVISSLSYKEGRSLAKYFRPLEISMTKGVLMVSYNSNKMLINNLVENDADWRSPKKLMVRCVSNPQLGPVTSKSINLANLKFYKD